MKQPTISVIMLTYNRENLVGRAIESVLAQTFTDFEFIIVDNGSTDNSGKVADNYAEKDNRIRVIHRKRGNIGSGRNAGLDAANGEYIAFIDDDDWCEPDFLEFLHSLAVENDADIAICGATDKVYDEKRVYTPEEAIVELLWRRKYSMGFPAKLFSQRLAEKIRFPEDDKYDDISQMHVLLANGGKIAYHGLLKYNICRFGDNNSSWTTNHSLLNSTTLDEYLRAYRIRTEWLLELFPNNAAIWRYFEWSFMISMVEKITRLGISGCENQLGMMKRELRNNLAEFINCEWILDFEKEWVREYVG